MFLLVWAISCVLAFITFIILWLLSVITPALPETTIAQPRQFFYFFLLLLLIFVGTEISESLFNSF